MTTLTVLGSGSSGNASLLEIDGFGLLIDAGLGPRQIAKRLELSGRSWHSVDAVILSHTHCDHWREATLAQLARLDIPLYCHPQHARRLRYWSAAFSELQQAQLVRTYDETGRLPLQSNIVLQAFRLSHDDPATFGFRIDRGRSLFAPAWSMAYAADLGTWDSATIGFLIDADLLALEFNHDPPLQKSSGRPVSLINRVLGDEGHLSNAQAASLLNEVARASRPGRLRQVVQLHLSRQCNRPGLAASAARAVLAEHGPAARLHTASQHEPICVRMDDR